MAATGTGSPCGACKFLRRKCAADCIFAPYFCTDQGPARFAAIHKVFGASNVSKMLLHVPVHDRCDAVVTIDYEARARIKDPVYGCVAHIFALQQQVVSLQAQVMQVKAQLAQTLNTHNSRSAVVNQSWPNYTMGGVAAPPVFPASVNSTGSPESSMDSFDGYSEGFGLVKQEMMMMMQNRDNEQYNYYYGSNNSISCNNSSRKRASQTELGELQALALRMMRN